MKKYFLAVLLLLASGTAAQAQSVALTGTVTDTPDSQTWNNGTITFTFFGPQGTSYTWRGGTIPTPITATLSATGTYSASIPDNSQMNPADSSWTVKVCPAVLPAISACFISSKVITSASTVLNLAPPSPRFSIPLVPQNISPVSAYADTEITGGWVGFQYYNLVNAAFRVCQVMTGSSCTTWAAVGGGSSTFASIPGEPGLTALPVTNGLMAEYRILPGETVNALTDYSGNARTCSARVGTIPSNPTNTSVTTGGILFSGSGAVPCPSVLNSAQTIVILADGLGINAQNTASMVSGNTAPNVYIGAKTSFISGGTGADPSSQGAGKLFIGSSPTGGQSNYSRFSIFAGAKVITATFGASNDELFVGSQQSPHTGSATNEYLYGGGSAGVQTTGAYQIGGATVSVFNGFWFGHIYYVGFYNRILNAAEVAQNATFLNNIVVPQRLISIVGTGASDTLACDGDSITAGQFIAVPFCGQQSAGVPAMVLNVTAGGTAFVVPFSNQGINANTADFNMQSAANNIDPFYSPNGTRNVVHWFLGANNSTALVVQRNLVQYAHDRHLVGWKVIAATMSSMAGGTFLGEVERDKFNTWLLANSAQYVDGVTPFHKNVHIGADNADASGTYFNTVHPLQPAIYNILVPVVQHTVNGQLYGNFNFSNATTYTTASATVAITAASESGNTMTFTVAAGAPPAGRCVNVSGVTPAGYNSGSQTGGQNDDCWFVLSSTGGTSFTAFNYVTGLGAGTVFGTFQAPLQTDADESFIINSAGAINVLMQPCYLFNDSEVIKIQNIGAGAATFVPFGAIETVTGTAAPTTIASNTTAFYQSLTISLAAAGCGWKRLQ